MQIKDMKAGDNIEVIELAVKSVGQGKIGKTGTAYQHLWLTDGTGDIRFSLFGEDVNKIQQGQTVKIISGYVKEYPVGSGKLQLALSRDGGNWQVVNGEAPPTKREDIVPAPVQIVSSDAKEEYITRRACLHVIGQIFQGEGELPPGFLELAQTMYEWVMEEEKPEQDNGLPSQAVMESKKGVAPPGKGPQATKLELITKAALKENAGWTGPPTTDMIKKFAAVMNGVLGGDKERHTWLKWTYGKESSKEVTGAKLQVVLDMLKPTYTDKKWVPTQNAEAIKAMFKQALIDSGQTTLDDTVEELYGPQEDLPF